MHGCAGGQHRDGRTGACHTHPAPSTCSTTYQTINGGSHSTAITPACPLTDRSVDTCPVAAPGMHGNGYLREPDEAVPGTGEYAVIQCVPTPTHATLVAECAAVSPNDVTTTSRVVAVVGLFYNATLEAATVADSQRVHPQIIGFTGTYRYWFMQNGAVTSATVPLTATVVSTAGADGQKVWSSLINPD